MTESYRANLLCSHREANDSVDFFHAQDLSENYMLRTTNNHEIHRLSGERLRRCSHVVEIGYCREIWTVVWSGLDTKKALMFGQKTENTRLPYLTEKTTMH